MREQKLNGFSLMEMMIVLLIVAVIAAASAPLVTKKMSSTGGTLDSSPWVYTGVAKSIAYNMDGSASSAIIGASKVPNGSTPKLYIESSGDEAQIGFGRAGSNDVMSFTMDTVNKRIGFTNTRLDQDSIFIGLTDDEDLIEGRNNIDFQGSIMIGHNVTGGAYNYGNGIYLGNNILLGGTLGGDCIIIGNNTYTNGAPSEGAIAIGEGAGSFHDAVAIGHAALAEGTGAIAIGGGTTGAASFTPAQATGTRAIAIGEAEATHNESVAIGYGAKTQADSQIVLGSGGTTVYIPGNLVVGGNTLLGLRNNTFTVFRNGSTGAYQPVNYQYENGGRLLEIDAAANKTVGGFTLSDRRIKNIGDKFTAGVNELSKLDFFHYTFKKDEAKTPHVGVIAQDLQKVFPDAVTKGDDGFLRIRWEDMFYAAINAIKELNTKITEIADNLMNTNSKVEEQAKIIEEQQNTIENQQKTIDSLIKRIESIEKKI